MPKQVKAPKCIVDKKGAEWFLVSHGFSLNEHNTPSFIYKSIINECSISSVFSVDKIEKCFLKVNRMPSSIPVTQGYYECAVASMAMITGKEMEDVRSALWSHGWVVGDGISLTLQRKAFRSLGYSSMIHYRNPYQPCIVTLPSLNISDTNHQVYWNGKEILDPQFDNDVFWYGPDWGLDEIGALMFLTVSKI